MRHRAAQLLERDLLVRHRLDHVRPGHEHVAGVLDHDDEVGHRRGVDRPARAGPHDHRDLRDDAGGQRVAQEDVGVAAERDHALLDARAAGVVQADDRRAGLHRHVHDLDDLLGVRLGEAAAEHREVLREHVDQPPVDRPPAGDDAVAEKLLVAAIHAEVALALHHEHIQFVEAAGVEQHVQPLACGHLTARMLPLDAGLAAALACLFLHCLQLLDLRVVCHWSSGSL